MGLYLQGLAFGALGRLELTASGALFSSLAVERFWALGAVLNCWVPLSWTLRYAVLHRDPHPKLPAGCGMVLSLITENSAWTDASQACTFCPGAVDDGEFPRRPACLLPSMESGDGQRLAFRVVWNRSDLETRAVQEVLRDGNTDVERLLHEAKAESCTWRPATRPQRRMQICSGPRPWHVSTPS